MRLHVERYDGGIWGTQWLVVDEHGVELRNYRWLLPRLRAQLYVLVHGR